MLITSVRLVDGVREMVIYPRDSIAAQSLTLSSPDVREVSDPRTDDDGESDDTELFGSRSVSLELVVYEDPGVIAELLDELTSYLHPRLRPYLYVVDDGWVQERRIKLRSDQWSAPYSGYVSSLQRSVQQQWKAPDGVWEAADLVSVTVNADVSEDVGVAFPLTFPVAWTPTQATGAQLITVAGKTPSHFVARLYGPCSGPVLSNDTTGETLAFTAGLTIPAGDYVEINTRDRTAYYLSQTDASRLNLIDFTTTMWWRLEPGDNLIRYHPSGITGNGAAAVLDYRPTWL